MKKIKGIKTVAFQITLLLLAVLLFYVLCFSMCDWNSALFFMEKFSATERVCISMAGIGLLLMLSLLLYRWIQTKNDRSLAKISYFLLGMLFILQILYLYAMKVGLRYDALKIVDEAISLVKTGEVSAEHLDGYFARYTNNYGILFLTAGILKVAHWLKIAGDQFQNATFILGIVNILMIDMGIFFGWRLAGKCRGGKAAFLCLVWSICNPYFVIWTPFYYTNTVSMGLMMAAIYGTYRLFEEKGTMTKKKQAAVASMSGIVFMLACTIRATVYITAIALVGYFLLRKGKERKNEESLQNPLIKLLGLFMGMFVVIAAWKCIENKVIPFDTTDTAFPAMHWIAMGAGGQGMYNIVDEYYTMGFPTKEEKQQKDTELFLERLKELGAGGYGRLMLAKLRLTWSDGSGGYLSELGVSQRYLTVHKYVLGGKSDFLAVYGAVFYSFSLFLVLAGVLNDLRKKQPDFLYVIKLNLLGAFFFHMLWEAGTIYSIGFLTLLQPAMPDGFWPLQGLSDKLSVRKRSCAGVFFTAILVMVFLGKRNVFLKEGYVTNEACVNQFLYQCDEDELLLDNQVYVQSFVGDKLFNRLGVQVKNLAGDSNQSRYTISLWDSENNVVTKKTVSAADISGYDFITLTFDAVDGTREENYFIVIEKAGGNENAGLAFLSYNTGNYDAYRDGSLKLYEKNSFKKKWTSGNWTERTEEKENVRDLAFCVYYQEEKPYLK